MLTLICPTCRQTLSVRESPVGYVVTCAVCRNALTVPAFTPTVTSAPESLIYEPPERRREPRGTRWLGVSVLAVVCLLLMVVLAVLMPTRGESVDAEQEKRDYRAALHFEESYYHSKRARDIAQDLRGVYRMNGDAKQEAEVSAQLDEIEKSMRDVEREHYEIVTKYPKWGKRPLRP